MTPTQRSLALLRERGYTAAVVERWNAFARVRQDLFGFVDIVAVKAGEPGVVAVQSTSADNLASRRTKIAAEPRAAVWLAAGNRIVLHGWRKGGPRGTRKRWQVNEENVETEKVIHHQFHCTLAGPGD